VNVPERIYPASNTAKKLSFRALLQSYVKNKQVFVCPEASNLNSFATFNWEALGYEDGPGIPTGRLEAGYGMNRVHYGGGNVHPSTGDNYGVPDATVVAPSECILLEDSISGFGPNWDGWYSVFYGPTAPGYIRGVTKPDSQLPNKPDLGAFRHNGGATYIFVDGHAHWYRPEQIPCSKDKCWWAIENHH
jgi:prepilin-type processing-associated H-X9-DG protein